MGNHHRFKLSDMIPNAWFYKLKYMNMSTTNTTTSTRWSSGGRHASSASRNPNSPPPSSMINPSYPSLIYSSYSIPYTDSTHNSPDPPRTSSRRSRRKPPRRRTVYRPSPSEAGPDGGSYSSDEDVSSDIVLDMNRASMPKLPPIGTRQSAIKLRSKRTARRGAMKSAPRPPGPVSFRNEKIGADSFAVVKSSVDPVGDFRDSMEEMIREHKIRDSGDLEDLLACYLSLNSSRFHDQIVRAFEQIWFGVVSRH